MEGLQAPALAVALVELLKQSLPNKFPKYLYSLTCVVLTTGFEMLLVGSPAVNVALTGLMKGLVATGLYGSAKEILHG